MEKWNGAARVTYTKLRTEVTYNGQAGSPPRAMSRMINIEKRDKKTHENTENAGTVSQALMSSQKP